MCGGLEYNCPDTSSPAFEQNSVAAALDDEAMLLFIFTKKNRIIKMNMHFCLF